MEFGDYEGSWMPTLVNMQTYDRFVPMAIPISLLQVLLSPPRTKQEVIFRYDTDGT